ncbi:MAG: hypothetical protein WCG55_03030 [bacterium]
MKKIPRAIQRSCVVLFGLTLVFVLFFHFRKQQVAPAFVADKNIVDPALVTGIYQQNDRYLLVVESKIFGTDTESDMYIIDYNVPLPASRIVSTPLGRFSKGKSTYNFDAAHCIATYSFAGSKMYIAPNTASCMAEPNLEGIYTKISAVSPEHASEIVSNIPEVKKWLPRIKGNTDWPDQPPYIDAITSNSYTIVVPGLEKANIFGIAPMGPYKVSAISGDVVPVPRSR